MRDKGYITKYQDGVASVIPLLSDTCINCNSPTCAKKGTPFQAANPRNLKLQPGDIVKIEASPMAQIVQGVIALLFPVGASIAGFFLAAPLAQLFGRPVTEGIRAATVLLLLAIATAMVVILTRKLIKMTKPEVVAVLEPAGSQALGTCPL